MAILRRIGFSTLMKRPQWGGSEELWAQAALVLRRDGINVGVHVPKWSPLPQRIIDLHLAGANLLWHEDIRIPLGLKERIGTKLRMLLGTHKENRNLWFDEFDPELVVISLPFHTEGVELAQACRSRGVPYVLVIQAASFNYWPADNFIDRVADMYLSARMTCFVSENNQRLVETQLATRLSNACIVRNPFNVDYDTIIPWPNQTNTLRFACVGRLEPLSKGQDILFEVLAKPHWRCRQILLSLFGQGCQERTLRRLVELHKLKNVEFAGFRKNTQEIWHNHHVLVLPSRYEGLPIVVVEAMLCGRPCVVTDVAGNAELLEDNVTGFVAAAPKIECLEEALERAWQRRHELQLIGELAARHVRSKVSPNPAFDFAQLLRKAVTN